MELAFSEILVIALAIVVLFGPDKLPQIARDLGSGVRKMKGAVEDIKTEILKETENPVSEIKKEIDKVKEAAQEYNFSQTFKDEIDELGRTPKQVKEEQLKDTHEGPVSR